MTPYSPSRTDHGFLGRSSPFELNSGVLVSLNTKPWLCPGTTDSQPCKVPAHLGKRENCVLNHLQSRVLCAFSVHACLHAALVLWNRGGSGGVLFTLADLWNPSMYRAANEFSLSAFVAGLWRNAS